MPSNKDERVETALRALAGPIKTFQSALSATVEQVKGILATQQSSNGDQEAQQTAALGVFASGRIDTDRFSKLFDQTQALDSMTVETIERALEALSELASHKQDLFVVNVEPGGSLRQAVCGALKEVGRAFGAARVAELSKSGSYHHAEHAKYLGSFPFSRWNKTERRIAPPLVVGVDGRDLCGDGLAEFLDGAQKFVLVVRGEIPPAPLVHHITPGTFVLQTADEASLARFAAWDGPGVAAIVPASAARFTHDPGGGPELSRRISVEHMPEDGPSKALGGLSADQQRESLRQLAALAAQAAAPAPSGDGQAAAPAAPATPADPVDRLAAWLLSQADLSNTT
jgi:hypothetical protein